MLVRLIYASRSCEPIGHELIDNILSVALRRNLEHGITGVLCYSDRVFVQALEGGREQVNALYRHLLQDSRHKDVILLAYEEINVRHYPTWTMGRVRLDKVNRSLLLKYSCTGTFDPYEISGSTTIALLADLATTGVFAMRD